ncbi:MAG: hypothetical protein QOF25_4110, partial [Mycobacterium sp.]|nr:hypothetical protein [Mycobacterium sp.]
PEHWGSLLYSAQTGKTAAEKLRGVPIFDYLETNPEYARVFNEAMTGVSAMSIDAAVLAQSPPAQGVLFDLPSVVEGAGRALDAAGVTQRCTVTGGSFFDSVPDGGDAYLLKSIIHDWDDASALTILRNVRAAIAPDGKLLLLELVLPEGAPPHPGMLLDIEMLVNAGGREGTAPEYADLLLRAGFRQTRVIPTAGPSSIVEAVPA